MRLTGSTIAVTGATGFLGRYLVEVLQGRGARVVGVVRSPEKAPELRDWGVELRRADLADPSALAEAFRGADAVVANAALFSLGFHRNRVYRETNLQGTRNVFEAIAKAGVGRAVQISSVAAYRGGGPKPLDEEQPLREAGDRAWPWTIYAITKAVSEHEARRLADSHGIELSVLRPSGIYGAFDTNFMRTHKALMRPPISIYTWGLHVPWVYAGDVADAAARALEADVAVGRAYNVAGPPGTTSWDFLRAWRAAGGRTPRLVIPIPVPVHSWISTLRAERELGWRNRSLFDGLRETLAAEAAGPATRRIETGSATHRPAEPQLQPGDET